MPLGTDHQLRIHLPQHARGKFRRRCKIHGNNHTAARRTSKESCNPFGAVLSPEHDPIAFSDTARVELSRKTKSGLCHLAVRPAFGAVSAAVDVGARLASALKFLQIIGD
jgi:hypothetical protein